MKTLKESILSSNNAQGLAKRLLDIFRLDSNKNDVKRLNELWSETDFNKTDYRWGESIASNGYNYENYNGQILLATRDRRLIYVRKGSWSQKKIQELIELLNLKINDAFNREKFIVYNF